MKSLSLVLVVIGRMPMPICNRFHERQANNGKITTFTRVPLSDDLVHRCEIQRLIGQKSHILPTPSHLAPSFGMIPSNLWKTFAVPETKVFQAADGEDLVILAYTAFD